MRASSRRRLSEGSFVRDYSCATRPATRVSLDPAFEPGRVEGRIAAARMERGRIEHIRFVRIEADDVRRRADRKLADRQLEDLGRTGGHRADKAGKRNMARRDQSQARRQHRLDADRARRRLGEREPLGLDVLRIVVGADDVDEACAQGLDQRHALVFGAQRRAQLQKSAIVADIELIEGQVIDRRAAGRRQARFARPRHRLERKTVRDERRVIARAGQRDQTQIALEHDRLRLARHARQAKPARAQAFRHDALAA